MRNCDPPRRETMLETTLDCYSGVIIVRMQIHIVRDELTITACQSKLVIITPALLDDIFIYCNYLFI
jgi:hypothetical protein